MTGPFRRPDKSTCGELDRLTRFCLITKKGNQNIALITYEVSTDGQTLTVRTSGLVEQVVIFKRREMRSLW